MRDKIYYVYTLARPTGEIFYVGKGKGNRIDWHEVEARNGVKSYKCNIIRKIWREGGQVIKTRVYEGLTEREAFERERTLIATYGRERLTNLTDGGQGWSGHYHTPISNGTSRVEYYRTRRGLSIAELARRAHLDQRTVKRAEVGGPIERQKAALLAQAISQIAGKSLSVEDLGIAIYS
jgi:hypothetical protein